MRSVRWSNVLACQGKISSIRTRPTTKIKVIELLIIIIGAVIGYIIAYRIIHPDAIWRFVSFNQKRKTMSTWNYRLVKHRTPVEDFYSIHEVYYDENGGVRSFTENGSNPNGFETPEEVKNTLNMMLEAFSKPTLEEKDDKLVEVENDKP